MNWLFEWPYLLRGVMIIAVEIGVVVSVLFVLQKLGVKAIGGLTVTAWFQGLRNAFFTSILVGVVIGAITIISVYGFGQSVKNGLVVSGAILWLVMFGWFISAWFSRKQRAGNMLIDLIAFPNKTLFFVMSALVLVIGFIGGLSYGWNPLGYSRLVSIVFGLSGGVWFILMGLSRIQIHQNGVLIYVDLIKWSKIESFEWVYENRNLYTLKLRFKGKLPSVLRSGAIPVPAEKKDKLDSLFKQYLPELVLAQNHF